MLLAILNICSKEEFLSDDEDTPMPNKEIKTIKSRLESIEEAEQRKMIMKKKILAIGKISRDYSILRENSEQITELKSLSPSGKLPLGTLALGAEGIKTGNNVSTLNKKAILILAW